VGVLKLKIAPSPYPKSIPLPLTHQNGIESHFVAKMENKLDGEQYVVVR
jgi:hypothetical protein